MKLIEEYEGFEAVGDLTLEGGKQLIKQSVGNGGRPFAACAIGNMLNNADMWEQEKAELIKLLEEHKIPYKACPTFGDSASVLKDLGLIESALPPKRSSFHTGLSATAAIAG
eukprot:CAMPEP_0174724210 /NCGR_PEP_ID=MMETSP1094-20130205/42825_1 /TAXON_ID=156173 /ORGANISM="Chrysochromulina brevifilum, Strain UTEX LB 985" /LENGTH=111 /DNA_ID=CAMNT_0015925395 /DNA_START=79 /DNA_END=414 /DNA_ORIENTATION=+